MTHARVPHRSSQDIEDAFEFPGFGVVVGNGKGGEASRRTRAFVMDAPRRRRSVGCDLAPRAAPFVAAIVVLVCAFSASAAVAAMRRQQHHGRPDGDGVKKQK